MGFILEIFGLVIGLVTLGIISIGFIFFGLLSVGYIFSRLWDMFMRI